eukprot:s56_g20.t1
MGFTVQEHFDLPQQPPRRQKPRDGHKRPQRTQRRQNQFRSDSQEREEDRKTSRASDMLHEQAASKDLQADASAPALPPMPPALALPDVAQGADASVPALPPMPDALALPEGFNQPSPVRARDKPSQSASQRTPQARSRASRTLRQAANPHDEVVVHIQDASHW